LRVVDISTPASPVEVGSINTPIQALGVVVAGNYAYIADNLSGLPVVNISNPV
jgi:hypothetical protein